MNIESGSKCFLKKMILKMLLNYVLTKFSKYSKTQNSNFNCLNYLLIRNEFGTHWIQKIRPILDLF